MKNKRQKVSIKFAFDDVFAHEDKFFGEWFIAYDESFELFLEKYKHKDILFKQLRYFLLYLESLNVLKTQSESTEFSIARVYSRETWYCCVLLLLVGLIDQHTKQEVTESGKLKSQKDRFQLVMNCLKDSEKRHFKIHYNGSRFKDFNKLTSHIYSTRNFFAHEIIVPENGVPQDGHLGIDSKNIGTMFINMPHGQIFLYIVVAFIRYLGFKGELDIKSNKKFDSIVDLLRRT